MAVDANARYKVTVWLVFNSPAAADLKVAWTTPAGVSGWWRSAGQFLGLGTDTVSQGALTWSTTAQLEGAAADKSIELLGVLVTGVTSGTLQLQWAQNTSTPSNTTVKAYSVLTLQKIV